MALKSEAEKLVINYINDNFGPDSDDIVIQKSLTIEKDWGWVVFYNSKTYLETGDISHALAGNAPLLVLNDTKEILVTGTEHPVEHYISRFELTGNPHD